MVFAPYVVRYIPLTIRRALAPYIPSADWQDMRAIVYEMERQSKRIFYSKRAALEKGDAVTLHEIGEGRDLMSILSESSSTRGHGVIALT